MAQEIEYKVMHKAYYEEASDYLNKREGQSFPLSHLDHYPGLIARQAQGSIVGVLYSNAIEEDILEFSVCADSSEVSSGMENYFRKLVPPMMWPIVVSSPAIESSSSREDGS